MQWVLGISMALLAYTYLGYPVVIWVLSKWRGRPVQKGVFEGGGAVLISAFNEEETLPRKVKNLLELAQSEPIREIWIGLDGCTDDSASRVQSFFDRITEFTGRDRMTEGEEERRFRIHDSISNIQYPMSNVQGGPIPTLNLRSFTSFRHCGYPKVTILDFKTRRGKAAVLNDLMVHATQPILVMMDARQRVEAGAVSHLLKNFADPQVGVVSGALAYETSAGAAQKGAESYWGYERFIRECESRYWAVPGATGALYAIRRELSASIPTSTLVDDVLIPMRAVMNGFRCLFEPAARVYDLPSDDFIKEEIRKRRTLSGILQLVFMEPKILSVCSNPVWFQFFSHKFLRLLTPMLLFLGLISSAIQPFRISGLEWGMFSCCGQIWGGGVFWIVVASIVASAIAYLGEKRFRSRIFGLMGAFFGVNRALILAAWDAWTGRFEARWKKSP